MVSLSKIIVVIWNNIKVQSLFMFIFYKRCLNAIFSESQFSAQIETMNLFFGQSVPLECFLAVHVTLRVGLLYVPVNYVH